MRRRGLVAVAVLLAGCVRMGYWAGTDGAPTGGDGGPGRDAPALDGDASSLDVDAPILDMDGGPVADGNVIDVPTTLPDYGTLPCSTSGWCWRVPAQTSISGIGAFWGSSPTDIYALGGSYLFFMANTLAHFNGATWTESTLPSGYYNAIWGDGAGQLFVVGLQGQIARWTAAGGWQPMTSGTTETLYALTGCGTTVYAVGGNETVLQLAGTTWTTSHVGSNGGTLQDVWCGGGQVFAVGGKGRILRYDGSSWSSTSVGASVSLRAVWGTGPQDVYAVGSSGAAFHFDGTTWAAINLGTNGSYYDVGSCGSGVYVVGRTTQGSPVEYFTLHNGGTGWTQLPDAPPRLQEVTCLASGDLYFLGSGLLYRLTGPSFEDVEIGSFLHGLWGAGARDLRRGLEEQLPALRRSELETAQPPFDRSDPRRLG